MDAGYLWMYSVVSTTVLVIGAKEQVMLRIWRTFTRLSKSSKELYYNNNNNNNEDENDSKESRKQRIIFKQISDVALSQFIAWMTLMYLVTTPILRHAFNNSPSPLVASKDTILLICLQAGRMLYKTYFNTFIECHPVEMLHYGILSLAYLTFLSPGASTVVALIGIVGDVAEFHEPVAKILDAEDIFCYHKVQVVVYAFGVFVTIVGRCLLPLFLVVWALMFGNPVNMSRSSLALFFFFLTYMTAINVFLSVNVVIQFKEVRSLRRLYKSAIRDSRRSLELSLSVKNFLGTAFVKGRTNFLDLEVATISSYP